MKSKTTRRKEDHIRICLEKSVEARNVRPGFDDVHLIHRCLPEVDPSELDLSTDFLGFVFKAPIMISAMTGGTPKAAEINANLARAAEEHGIGMCLGSGRALLEEPTLEYSFKVARENAPSIFISANIGFQELFRYSWSSLKRLVESVGADALTIHLNPLHELLQHEEEPRFRGALEMLRKVIGESDVPVIVKETGSGISMEDAELLSSIGVDAIEVAGAGGTSWASVEYYRNLEAGEGERAKLAEAFWDWGIPTVSSIIEVRSVTNIPLIASGGVRSGLDIAKAIVLGADLAGLALPLLKSAMEGWRSVSSVLRRICEELKLAMLLTGSKTILDLKGKPYILTGFTRDWVRSRGLRVRCGI